MSGLKVSDFDDADPLDGSELVGLVQNTENRKATIQDLADIINELSAKPIEQVIIAVTDETTAITAGTHKRTLRLGYAFTLTEIPRASLVTPQTSGSIFTVDINEAGVSLLSTKLTIDNTEETSASAATAAVVSDSSIADDAKITIDVDQIGDGTAKGLKVILIGRRT